MSYFDSGSDSNDPLNLTALQPGYAVEKETVSKLKVNPAYKPGGGTTTTRKMHIADTTQVARSNLVKTKAIMGDKWDPMLDAFIQNPELKTLTPPKSSPGAISPVSAAVKSSSGATIKGKYFMALRSLSAERCEVLFCQDARVAVVAISSSCFFVVDLDKQTIAAILSGVGSLAYWHHESLYIGIRPSTSSLVIVSLKQIKKVARIILAPEGEERATIIQIRGDILLLSNSAVNNVTQYWLIKLPGHDAQVVVRPEARVKLPLGIEMPTLSADGTVLSFWTNRSVQNLDETKDSWEIIFSSAAKAAIRTQVRVCNYFARKTSPTETPPLQLIDLVPRATSVSSSIPSVLSAINSEVSLAFEPTTGSSYLLYNQADLVKAITGSPNRRLDVYRSRPTTNIISPAPFSHVPVVHAQGSRVSGMIRSNDSSVWVNDATVLLTPVQNSSNQTELRVSHTMRPRGGIEPINSSRKNLVLLPESSMIAYLNVNGCLSRRVDCAGGELFVVLDKR